MTIADEFRTRNFSIYGQWAGILDIIICFAIGIAAIFLFGWYILFAAFCIASGFVIVFLEIPLLMRICPISENFETFIRRFTTNYMRAAVYAIMSAVQWLSLAPYGSASILLVPAITLLITACFYLLAAVKGQGFIGSKTLGGQGVAQMIV